MSNSFEREDEENTQAHFEQLLIQADQVEAPRIEDSTLANYERDGDRDPGSRNEDNLLTFGNKNHNLPSSQEYAAMRSKYAKDLSQRQSQSQTVAMNSS